MGSSDSDVLDVVVVGAGFGGICIGHDLLEAGNDSFVLVDAADGVGGTWRHNTYPGAACDVPSHLYCFTFFQNPEWSRVYSPQAEIKAYAEAAVEAFGLRSHLRLGQAVVAHRFDDATQLWTSELEDGTELVSRFVVRAAGPLHKPHWPDVEGLQDFAGALMHSSRWDHDVDLAGKRVGVIGSAASAIQIVPEVAKVASSLTVFQRTPNYILPRADRDFTEEEKAEFRRSPSAFAALRAQMMAEREVGLWPLFQQGEHNQLAREFSILGMHEVVDDPVLREKLTPSYELGCKRVLISDNWFQTLVLPHVDLVTEPIAAVTAAGVATGGGTLHQLDVLVCATGYDVGGHALSVPIEGAGGRTLAEAWADDRASYRGVAVPGFPNLFLVAASNAASGFLSSISTIEIDSRYIVTAITAAGRDKVLDPRKDASDAWNAALQERFTGTVWAGSCSSWYKEPDGRNWTLYPGPQSDYAAEKAEVLLDEYVVAAREQR